MILDFLVGSAGRLVLVLIAQRERVVGQFRDGDSSTRILNTVALAGVDLLPKELPSQATMALQKILAIAEIAMSVPKQWAANSEAGAKISAMAPPFTVPLGVAYTVASNALSTAGAAAATAKILGLGFQEGGAIGVAQLDPNGKLLDAEGFPIAGVVHENEYVIPEWLRKDPEVVQVEQWLEAKRQRGFRGGGATSDEVAQPTKFQQQAATDSQLLAVLVRLDTRPGREEEWATKLQVVQHTGELADDIEYVKKVRDAGSIS